MKEEVRKGNQVGGSKHKRTGIVIHIQECVGTGLMECSIICKVAQSTYK